MRSLTGLAGFDWVLAQVYAILLALALGSVLWRSAGSRVLGALVVPFAVGASGCVLLAALFRAETAYLISRIADRPAAVGVTVAVVFVGVAVADLLVSRVSRLLARCFRGHVAHAADVSMVATLTAVAAVGLAGLVRLDGETASGFELSQPDATGSAVVADFELPDQPMDIVFRNRSEGYISLEEGSIARFALPDSSGGDLQLSTVAEGLQSPRGIGIVGDVLVVAELGPLPCGQTYPCKGENVQGASSIEDGERRILRESRGRLLGFEIQPDGALARRHVILDELPVANTDHGVNAVQAGPDGRVYVSIGNVDRLAGKTLTEAERARPNFGLLGTVISVLPDGRDVRVVASGLRNVYDLAFDHAGSLYGVDNDGLTAAGWRREEVLQIRSGDDFGYPQDGTYGPYTRRTAPPLWVLETVGSAGVESVRSGDATELVVGSCSDVYSVELAAVGTAAVVRDRQPVTHLVSVPGCVTGIEPAREDMLAMTLFTFGGPPRLYLVRIGA